MARRAERRGNRDRRRARWCGGAAGWLDPSAAQAFEGHADDIFAELEAGSVWDAVLGVEPTPPVTIPQWRLDDIAALPHGRITVLGGQQHIANDLVPEVFAEHVVAFLRDQPT